jgi:cysteine sulfinate desulfinase/cysteine desulfurase-like protein
MEVPERLALGTIRFSTGNGTTPEDVDRAADMLVSALAQ